MGSRFLVSLIGAFLATLALLGGIGFAASKLWVTAPRELYRNAAIEFDLAPGWFCEKDGRGDVCHPAGTKPFPAIAVMAVKLRNNQDNLEAYEAHLKNPQRVGDRNAAEGPISEVRFVRRRTLGSREWVESLHLGSEIASFHTYYLATATSHVGILVTLSVHKDYEAQFVKEFSEMMASLKTFQR
jgi:hypothetical protein